MASGTWAIAAPMTRNDMTSPVEADDRAPSRVSDLAAQAKDGSTEAFNQLVRLFEDDVYRMVFYRVRSQADAEDIVQDVFFKAYRSIGVLKQTDRFRSWLFRISLNRVRDHYRKKRVMRIFRRTDDDDLQMRVGDGIRDGVDAEEAVMRQEFWDQVGAALDGLPRMEREVFLLRFFDHRAISEIAEILNRGESTVKTHLYRSLDKFRKDPTIRKLHLEGMP